MDKALHSFFNVLLACVTGPALAFLMFCIVISLARHPPSRLCEARVRRLPKTLS
jgi:hypothetical protein